MAQLRILGKNLLPKLKETRKKHIASLDETEAYIKKRKQEEIACVLERENSKRWRKFFKKFITELDAESILNASQSIGYQLLTAHMEYSSIETYKKAIRNLTRLIYLAEENENDYILITEDEMLGL